MSKINVCKPCFIKMRKCNEIEELSAIDTAGYYSVIVFEKDDYEEDFKAFKNDKMIRCAKYEDEIELWR